MLVISLAVLLAVGQAPSQATPQAPATGPGPTTGRGVVTNQTDTTWRHPSAEPAGVENSAIREDAASGALEMFLRYPAGYVIPAHWHTGNERIVLIEGRLQIDMAGKVKFLDAGGFAFLPSREVQKMSCVSKTRCVLYSAWDASFDNHKVAQ